MTTPHINAAPDAFADTVLLPGDPLRAEHIAETFLEQANQVTDVRNMLGFTGRYRGRRISVMGSGMGIPSISIYAKELITEYRVKRLLRVGTCGAVRGDVRLRDVIIAMGACTDSKTNRQRFGGHDFAAIASYDLLRRAVEAAGTRGIAVRVGNVFSSDLFYTPEPQMFDIMERFGILGVEMEAAGLYGVAAAYGAEALCILTVADHIRSGERAGVEERRSSFDDMVHIALDAAVMQVG